MNDTDKASPRPWTSKPETDDHNCYIHDANGIWVGTLFGPHYGKNGPLPGFPTEEQSRANLDLILAAINATAKTGQEATA